MDASIRRVVLIGFRGAGKSTLARALAVETKWPVVSTDERVEKLIELKIAEIVDKFGWAKFRDFETKVLREISRKTQIIVDCGGGVIENSQNMEILRPQSLVVWVDAAPDIILKRLESNKERPLLTEAGWKPDVWVHYFRRKPLYEKYSDLRIDTGTVSHDQNIETIMKELRKK